MNNTVLDGMVALSKIRGMLIEYFYVYSEIEGAFFNEILAEIGKFPRKLLRTLVFYSSSLAWCGSKGYKEGG